MRKQQNALQLYERVLVVVAQASRTRSSWREKADLVVVPQDAAGDAGDLNHLVRRPFHRAVSSLFFGVLILFYRLTLRQSQAPSMQCGGNYQVRRLLWYLRWVLWHSAAPRYLPATIVQHRG